MLPMRRSRLEAVMQNHKLIQPAHLNHYGFLFGGNMLKWVDEYGYIAACSEFPGRRFVTRSMENLNFKESVRVGEILVFETRRVHLGISSIGYEVSVMRASQLQDLDKETIFETRIFYVCVDENGGKHPIR